MKKASRAILAVTSALTFVLGVRSSTYLQDTTDAVALDVDFAALADGTTYPATVKLDAKAKNVTVDVKNSGYRKLGS